MFSHIKILCIKHKFGRSSLPKETFSAKQIKNKVPTTKENDQVRKLIGQYQNRSKERGSIVKLRIDTGNARP